MMGTTQRRQREAQQRRQSILDAAREVFWERGYQGATMPQIAEMAELAPGTLYLYFPSKDALYVELLSEGYDLLLERLGQGAHATSDPRGQAERLIDAFLGFAREFPEYFDIMFFVLQREGSSTWERAFPAEQVQRLKAKEADCKAAAGKVLEEIDFGPPQGREQFVDAIWGMLAGVVFYFRGAESFDAVAAAARELLLKATFGPN